MTCTDTNAASPISHWETTSKQSVIFAGMRPHRRDTIGSNSMPYGERCRPVACFELATNDRDNNAVELRGPLRLTYILVERTNNLPRLRPR